MVRGVVVGGWGWSREIGGCGRVAGEEWVDNIALEGV